MAPVSVTLGMCDANELFLRSCQESPVGAATYTTNSCSLGSGRCDLNPVPILHGAYKVYRFYSGERESREEDCNRLFSLKGRI